MEWWSPSQNLGPGARYKPFLLLKICTLNTVPWSLGSRVVLKNRLANFLFIWTFMDGQVNNHSVRWYLEEGAGCLSIVYRVRPYLKGTQDWEFFWLRFWNLHYFFVSYVKILRFYQKIFLMGPLLGEVRFFRVVLGLRRMKTNFVLGPKNFFFFFNFGP